MGRVRDVVALSRKIQEQLKTHCTYALTETESEVLIEYLELCGLLGVRVKTEEVAPAASIKGE